MSATGDSSGPAEREAEEGMESAATRRYEIERIPEAEPNPAAPTEIVEVRIPPEGPNPPVRRPTGIVVRRRKLALLYLAVILLIAIVGAMAYAMITNKNNQVVAVNSTSSATPSTQASATGTDPSSSPSSSGAPGASASADASASATGGSSATSTDTTSVSDGGTGFTPPFGTEYLPAPVDGDVYTQQDEHIDNVDYATSSAYYCPTSGLIDWNVAGYKTFTAEFGIPDNAQSATGVSNTITFTDQNGKTLNQSTASIGQPEKISFSVSGVDRLIMSCARQGSNNSANNLVTLGNALLSTS